MRVGGEGGGGKRVREDSGWKAEFIVLGLRVGPNQIRKTIARRVNDPGIVCLLRVAASRRRPT